MSHEVGESLSFASPDFATETKHLLNALRRLLDKKLSERLSSAPSPLNAYGLKIGGRPYADIAADHVHQAFKHGRDETLLGSSLQRRDDGKPSPVIDLMETSLMGALHQRLINNMHKSIPFDCDERSADLFARACGGDAGAPELLELLGRQPGLGSLELGKHTGPFDWDGTQGIDESVDTSIKNQGLSYNKLNPGETVQYFFNRVDDNKDPHAMVLVRKADIAEGAVYDANLVVVQRDCFVIDLDHEDAAAIREGLVRWLEQQTKDTLPGNKKARYDDAGLVEFMEAQLALPADRRSFAVCPAVRSYYARIATERPGAPDDRFNGRADESAQPPILETATRR